MNRQTVFEARCVTVADTLVPNYRNGSRAYSCGGHVAKMWQAAYDGAAAVLAGPLPADVRRLVIAARTVTDSDGGRGELSFLLDAVEEFSSRVPYENEPDEMPAAPRVEGLTSGEGEPVGAMLICDQTGGRMFTWWPVPQHQKQEADSIYGSHGGYRTVPLCAASPKATATASVGEDDEEADRTADEAVDFMFDRLARKLGLAEWQVVEGSEEWEGDVSATLHRLLVDAKIIDDETGAIATLTDSGTAATIGGERG